LKALRKRRSVATGSHSPGRLTCTSSRASQIQAIANGIGLVGYSSSTQFIVTGVILLAAVTLDTLSRRRLAKSGR